jgi:hypothetical protein
MTPQERMDKLIEHGAIIYVRVPGIVVEPMALAAVRWYNNPTKVGVLSINYFAFASRSSRNR